MSDYICDSIAEKMNNGANLWSPALRQVIGFMLNQTWEFPGLFALDLDEEGDVIVHRFFVDEPVCICTRDQLVSDILNLANFYELSEKERAYLLRKIPVQKRRRNRRGESTLVDKDLRITNRNGSVTYHEADEETAVIEFCRRHRLTLHKNVRGEWRQILP